MAEPMRTIDDIEAEVLQLGERERARLAHQLLVSLEPARGESFEEEWIEEALRRDAQIESGKVIEEPAEEVLRSIRASRT